MVTTFTDDAFEDTCKTITLAVVAIGILAAMLWLSVSIIGTILACKMFKAPIKDNCDEAGFVPATGVIRSSQAPASKMADVADIEVASSGPPCSSGRY